MTNNKALRLAFISVAAVIIFAVVFAFCAWTPNVVANAKSDPVVYLSHTAIKINGTTWEDDKPYYIDGTYGFTANSEASWTAYYNEDLGVLTLNGFSAKYVTIDNTTDSRAALKVVVKGSNSVYNDVGSQEAAFGVYGDPTDVSFVGEEDSWGMNARLSLESLVIDANSGACGLYVEDGNVSFGGYLTVTLEVENDVGTNSDYTVYGALIPAGELRVCDSVNLNAYMLKYSRNTAQTLDGISAGVAIQAKSLYVDTEGSVNIDCAKVGEEQSFAFSIKDEVLIDNAYSFGAISKGNLGVFDMEGAVSVGTQTENHLTFETDDSYNFDVGDGSLEYSVFYSEKTEGNAVANVNVVGGYVGSQSLDSLYNVGNVFPYFQVPTNTSLDLRLSHFDANDSSSPYYNYFYKWSTSDDLYLMGANDHEASVDNCFSGGDLFVYADYDFYNAIEQSVINEVELEATEITDCEVKIKFNLKESVENEYFKNVELWLGNQKIAYFEIDEEINYYVAQLNIGSAPRGMYHVRYTLSDEINGRTYFSDELKNSAKIMINYHNMTQNPYVEPDCVTDGSLEYYNCNVCGKYFLDELGSKPLSDDASERAEQIKLDMLGHIWGSWNVNSGKLERYCQRPGCGEKETRALAEPGEESVIQQPEETYFHVAGKTTIVTAVVDYGIKSYELFKEDEGVFKKYTLNTSGTVKETLGTDGTTVLGEIKTDGTYKFRIWYGTEASDYKDSDSFVINTISFTTYPETVYVWDQSIFPNVFGEVTWALNAEPDKIILRRFFDGTNPEDSLKEIVLDASAESYALFVPDDFGYSYGFSEFVDWDVVAVYGTEEVLAGFIMRKGEYVTVTYYPSEEDYLAKTNAKNYYFRSEYVQVGSKWVWLDPTYTKWGELFEAPVTASNHFNFKKWAFVSGQIWYDANYAEHGDDESAYEPILIEENYLFDNTVGGVAYATWTSAAHDWADMVPALAKTCTEDGHNEYHVCKECGYSTEIVDKATGHVYGDLIAAVTGDCDNYVAAHYECSVCHKLFVKDGSEYKEVTLDELKSDGHKWNEGVLKTPADCENPAVYTYTCTVCEKTKDEPKGEALGHTPEVIPAVPATCTEGGWSVGKKCSVCDKILEAPEAIAPLGHVEETIPAVAPTCTEKGKTEGVKCSRCGEILEAQEDVSALGHSWDRTATTKAPTCTETGIETSYCSRCDATQENEIAALGHDWATSYSKDDVNHWYDCSRCDEKKDLAAHVWSDDFDATCDTCGYVRNIFKSEGKYFNKLTANEAAAGVDVSKVFNQASADNTTVEIQVGESKIVFDAAAVKAVAGKTLTLTANFSSTTVVEGAKLVIELSLQGSTFESGKASVTVPFATAVPEGQVAKIYYISNDGRTDMNGTFGEKTASFDTNHFSTFAIVFEDVPKSGLSGGAIAGIVVGVVVVVAAAVVCVLLVLKKKKAAPKANTEESKPEVKEEVKEEAVETATEETSNEEPATDEVATEEAASEEPASEETSDEKK